MEQMKKYINNYINFYLENDDELTQKNEKKFRKIQNDEDIMNKLATELGKMKLVDMQDINYEISKLLNKEI
jgi:vesicle coat complex subunit